MINTVAMNEDPPVREDGSAYPFLMIHTGSDGESVVSVSDSNTELIGELIDGYLDLTHDEALVARYEHAVHVATVVQTSVAAQATESGDLVSANEPEDVLTAIFQERSVPFIGTETAGGERLLYWDHPVPLTLIDTDYQPHTSRLRPEGRIVWLSPSNEVEYLKSLTDVGFIHYLQATTADS